MVAMVFALAYVITVSGGIPAQAEVKPKHVSVDKGLALSALKRNVVVAPGSCWVNDKQVTVSTSVALPVPPCPSLLAKEEPFQISATSRPILSNCRASQSDAAPLMNVMVSSSVKVKSAPGKAGRLYKAGTDYLIDAALGSLLRTKSGAITEGQTVYVDYACMQKRLDTVAIDDTGTPKLLTGTLGKSSLEPAVVPANMLAIAHTIAEPEGLPFLEQDILPIACTDCNTCAVDRTGNRKAMSKTLKKLAAGEPVTIVFWGDSITAGHDATTKQASFPDRLLEKLHHTYPKATIHSYLAALGGATSMARLANVDKDVLRHKPDLVIMEFANDVHLPKEQLDVTYTSIQEQMEDAGAEVLLVNPHLLAPVFFGFKDWRLVASQYYYKFTREYAKAHNWALADVECRWETLSKEGLRPEFLLVDNRVNINDLGHTIYADTIMRCFL